MMGHKICFYGEIWLIFPKLSLLPLLIRSTADQMVPSGSVCVISVPYLPRPISSKPGRVAQSVGHLTHKSGVLGSIPGLATYFRFSFRFFKKGSCQLLAKVCARSTG